MAAPVLVTGGAGFIGSHLVWHLHRQGEAVRVLDLPGVSVAHLPARGVDILRGDIRDRAAVAAAVRGCRAVCHLAGIPHLWIHRRGRFDQVNHRGAAHVLDEAVRAGVPRILHTSTECLLTRARPDADRLRLADVVGPYGRSKFQAERHALNLARAGAPVVVVSPTLPVGPGDYGRSPPTQMLLDFCRGRRREYVDARLNLIDVRDVAAGLALALHRGVPGRRYLLGHQDIALRDLFGLLADLTGLPRPNRRVPYALALAAAYVSEWLADVYTHRPPAATVTGVKLTRRRRPCDPRPCLAELGLQPRDLRDSLADALVWFREVGWLGAERQAA